MMLCKKMFLSGAAWPARIDGANVLLMLAAAALSTAIAVNGLRLRRELFFDADKSAARHHLKNLSMVKKPAGQYQRIFEQKKIFAAQPGMEQRAAKPAFAVDEPQTALSDLQLSGIIQGVQGRQAIISNVKTDQTFFCFGGEEINGFLIREIRDNKVVLERNEQLVELRL